MEDCDDFNRLYERLVVRRTSKKKVKRVAIVSTQDEKAKDADTIEAVRLAERRKAQQEHDAKVLRTVKRLRLARNLRGFARSSRCNPHRLAFQLVEATEPDEQRFLQKYERVKRQGSRFTQRRSSNLERNMRLEEVAARLFLHRATAFRPDTTTTLEGRSRVVDELLFFSPPNSKFLSQIGYAERENVVPYPPSVNN